MSRSLSYEQQTPVTQFEASSPAALLERGLDCVRGGRYAEGVVFFALAREHLTANQIQLAAALDAFTEGHGGYWHAQQALQQASKHFVEIETEQQARVADLEKLLPALMEDVQKAQNIVSQ